MRDFAVGLIGLLAGLVLGAGGAALVVHYRSTLPTRGASPHDRGEFTGNWVNVAYDGGTARLAVEQHGDEWSVSTWTSETGHVSLGAAPIFWGRTWARPMRSAASPGTTTGSRNDT